MLSMQICSETLCRQRTHQLVPVRDTCSYVLPDGKSAYSCYPFVLHDTLVLPWDFKVQNGVMTLFTQSCSGWAEVRAGSCRACQRLVKNKILEGVLMRSEEGVHENSGLTYHGFNGIQEMFHRKNQWIEFYRMRGLNQAKKLLSKVMAL